MKTFFDLPYETIEGIDPKSTSLDVYAPPDARGLPVFVYVHGGSWKAGDKRLAGSKASFFTGAGWVFVSVNYRLLPAGRHPANVQDVAHALAWVHSNIAQYGGAPDKIFLMGHSAGAHLVSLVATDERRLQAAGKDLSILKGVIPLDTNGYDLAPLVSGKGRSNVYLDVFGDDSAVLKDASPIAHVAPGEGIPPFLIFHTITESRGPQAQAFADALRMAGVEARVIPVPAENHGQINATFGQSGDPETEEAMKFFNAILGKAPAPFSPPVAANQPASPFPAKPAFLQGDALYRDVIAYCDLGEHRTATKVDLATSEWLAGRMRDAGLQTTFHTFTLPQFLLEKASLDVGGQAVDVFPQWPVKPTDPRGVRAPLAWADEENPAGVKGKMVLTRARSESPRESRDQVERLAGAGAVGIVAVVDSPTGSLRVQNLSRPAPPPPIPVAVVGSKDEPALTRAAEAGAEATLLIQGTENPKAEAREVIGTRERGAKRIIVSTPYSGWFQCGGERGSGIAIFLGLARWAAPHESHVSYTFVASSAHELGYAGMQQFIEQLAPPPSDILCWLHLGASVAVREGRGGAGGASPGGANAMTNQDAFAPLLQRAFAAMPGVNVTQTRQPKGEMILALEKGYRVINLSGAGNARMHGPDDTADNSGPELLEPMASALTECLAKIEEGGDKP